MLAFLPGRVIPFSVAPPTSGAPLQSSDWSGGLTSALEGPFDIFSGSKRMTQITVPLGARHRLLSHGLESEAHARPAKGTTLLLHSTAKHRKTAATQKRSLKASSRVKTLSAASIGKGPVQTRGHWCETWVFAGTQEPLCIV